MVLEGEKWRALRGAMIRVVRLKMDLANIRWVRSRYKRSRGRGLEELEVDRSMSICCRHHQSLRSQSLDLSSTSSHMVQASSTYIHKTHSLFFAIAYNISYTPLNALHLLSNPYDDQLDSVIAVLVDQDLVLPRRRLRSRERARPAKGKRAISGLPYQPHMQMFGLVVSECPVPKTISPAEIWDSRRRTPNLSSPPPRRRTTWSSHRPHKVPCSSSTYNSHLPPL